MVLFCLLAALPVLGGCGGAVRPSGSSPAPVPISLPGGSTDDEAVSGISEPASGFSGETQAASAAVQGPAAVPIEVPAPESAVSETESEATASEAESSPDVTLPPAREFTEEDFHFYLAGSGERIDGKINVAFYPDQYGSDGKPDPSIRVWDSCEILHPDEMRAICAWILSSPLYDSEIYGRTADSMYTEWRAHNDVHLLYPNERTRHVDFNRADEGLSYADFWQRAVRDYLNARRP